MKKANEMNYIANEAIANERKAREQKAVNYVEELIAPQIERNAKMGKFEVFVSIDTRVDAEMVRMYLEINGYEVEVNEYNSARIAW